MGLERELRDIIFKDDDIGVRNNVTGLGAVGGMSWEFHRCVGGIKRRLKLATEIVVSNRGAGRGSSAGERSVLLGGVSCETYINQEEFHPLQPFGRGRGEFVTCIDEWRFGYKFAIRNDLAESGYALRIPRNTDLPSPMTVNFP